MVHCSNFLSLAYKHVMPINFMAEHHLIPLPLEAQKSTKNGDCFLLSKHIFLRFQEIVLILLTHSALSMLGKVEHGTRGI